MKARPLLPALLERVPHWCEVAMAPGPTGSGGQVSGAELSSTNGTSSENVPHNQVKVARRWPLYFARCLCDIIADWMALHSCSPGASAYSRGAASQDVFPAPEGEEPPVGHHPRAGELSFHAALCQRESRARGRPVTLVSTGDIIFLLHFKNCYKSEVTTVLK